MTVLLRDDAPGARFDIVFAHGAGAPMDSPFMDWFARTLSASGFNLRRFEFPYMAARRDGGTKRPPDRQPVLLESWREAVADIPRERLVLMGKSMGGRMASLIADELGARALILLGYPFHGPGKPDRLRVEHLAALQTPTLICQGTRDPLGGRALVPQLALSPTISIHWLEDGDHGFKPRKASGLTEEGNWQSAAKAITTFLNTLSATVP